jgi:deoxyadenosine/deoxycytidine kinase
LVMIGLYILLWGKNKEMKNRLIKLGEEAEKNNKEQEPQPQIQHLTVSCESRCQ